MKGETKLIALYILLSIATCSSLSVVEKCWSWSDANVGAYQNYSYQFIFAHEGDTVEMQCRNCNVSEPHDVNAYWTKADMETNRNKTGASGLLNKRNKPLEIDLKILDNTSLYIKKVQRKHSGLYNCYLNASSTDFKSSLSANFETYSYYLHVSDKRNKLVNGTYTEWNYYEDYVYKSGEKMIQSMAEHKKNGLHKPSLIVHWSSWGNCLCGRYKYDTRTYRYAYCCVKLNHRFILPCQSTILKKFHPHIAKNLENIFDFKEYRRCMDECVPAITEDEVDYKFRKTYYLRESSHQELNCMGTNKSAVENSTEILWIRDDKFILNKSKNAVRKDGKELRVAVDTFNTLYLTDVTKNEEGSYSCVANGVPIVKILIRIEPSNVIFTKECGQKLKILTWAIVSWIIIYIILEWIKVGMFESSKLRK